MHQSVTAHFDNNRASTTIMLSTLLTVAVFLLYSNIYENSFLFDDEFLIVHNDTIKSWHLFIDLLTKPLAAGSHSSNTYYRPLQQLLYLCTFKIAGLSLFAFHFLNVSLHAANACLILRLGKKLQFQTSAVFLAALLWAIHPIHTEAITYMSATADPLYGLFCLAGTTVLLPDFSQRRVWLASLYFVLALLSKESAICFPLLAGVLLYVTNEKPTTLKIYYCLWPLALIATIYLILHMILCPHQIGALIPSGNHKESLEDSLRFISVIPHYLNIIVFPIHLHFKHIVTFSPPWEFAYELSGITIVLLSITVILRQQTRAFQSLGLGILWFEAAFFPVSSIAVILYEHWMYLPTVGLFLGIVQTLTSKMGSYQSRLIAPLYLPLFCLLAWQTYQQNTMWHDPESFYGNSIRYEPIAPEAHTNLGAYYARIGHSSEALRQYETAEQEFEMTSDTVSVDNRGILETDFALSLLESSHTLEQQRAAIQHLEKALTYDPDNPIALRTLAKIFHDRGDEQKAIFYGETLKLIEQSH